MHRTGTGLVSLAATRAAELAPFYPSSSSCEQREADGSGRGPVEQRKGRAAGGREGEGLSA